MTGWAQLRPMAGSSLASLLMHVGVAMLIPAFAWLPSSAPPIETISFVHISHIEINERPAPHPQPRPVARTFRPVPVINLATHVELARLERHRKASPPPAVPREISAAPAVADDQQIGHGTSSGEPAPQATDSPAARAVASVGTHDVGGYLPFGAEQPDPVLDPGIRKQLTALGVHVTLVVTVNENGKTQNIAIDPPVDPQTRKQIESLLADASWDPAVCGGGIACEGRAVIRL